MDPPRELAQFRDCLLDLVLRAGEDLRSGCVSAGSFEPECDRQCQEPLLRPVVEVPLDPTPLGIGCRDDRPRDARTSAS
jgi:hypothetical protein